jgi:multidrug efflux system membrane fusion protein
MKKLIILILILGCSKKQSQINSPPRVKVNQVIQKTIPLKIDAIGHFVAYNSADIKAQVEGQLMDVHFVEGSVVEAGSTLFTIDPRTYENTLDEAMAQLEESKANLIYSMQQLNMYKGLVSDDYVSPLKFLEYKTENSISEAEVLKNEAAVRKAAINLDYCFIKAPFTGITSKRFIDVGNLIVNNGEPMVTIKQIDPIYVDFSIPERDFIRLMKEQTKEQRDLLITFPDEPGTPFLGKLVLIENEIDQYTGMIPLRGELKNHENLFWPGQFVRVQVILRYEENALLVPENAVNIGQKGRYALVIGEDNIAEYRSLEIGEQIGDLIQVKNGLKAGEKVVIEGQLNVKPKHPVTIVEKK